MISEKREEKNDLRSNIPEELKKLQNWVGYIIKQNGNKTDKIPMNVMTDQYAKSNDPRTWTDFDTAVRLAAKYGYHGVGFMFQPPYVGVDFDHCIIDGIIDPHVLEKLKLLDSYSEFSPSVTGIHTICKGEIPRAIKKSGIEIYTTGRFFTVTGNQLKDCSGGINQRTDELKQIFLQYSDKTTHSDRIEAILTKISQSQDVDKFNRLFAGQWEGDYPSQSEADLAFCSKLAFWTGKDAFNMDAIFRRSKLMREKWDEKHYGDGRTYGQAVVQTAVDGCTETYHSGGNGTGSDHQTEPQVLPVFSAKELERRDFPPVRWIVPDLLPEGLAMLAGKPKKGKSWMALGFGIAVATGGVALGQKIEPGKVLYLALEDGQRRIKYRVKTLLSLNERFPENLHFVDAAKFPRFNQGGLEMLLRWLDENSETRLVVIDTLGRVMPQQGRNSSQYQHEYGFLGVLQQEAVKRCLCILLIHHTRKMPSDDPFDTISGTLGVTGALDTMFVLKDSPSDRASAILYASGREIDSQELALKFDQGMWSILGNAMEYTAQETRSKILLFLRDGGTAQFPSNIATATGLSPNVVYQQLYRLKGDGILQQDRRGRYLYKGSERIIT